MGPDRNMKPVAHTFSTHGISKSLAAGFIASIVAISLWMGPGIDYFFKRLEFICLDSWSRLATSNTSSDIVLIAIDENSLEHGGPWPWKRSRYARLVDYAANSNAKVVALDLLLDRPRPSDPALSRALKEKPTALPVYTPDKGGHKLAGYGLFVEKIKVPPQELSQAASALGHVTLVYDDDGTIRRIPAFVSDSRATYPAFGVVLAALWQGIDVKEAIISPGHLYLDGLDIPLDRDGFFYIGYRGGPGSFPRVSAIDVLNGDIPAEIFRNKLVLIGMTSPGLADQWTTPFASQGGMTGLELIANVAQSILDKRVPQKIPPVAIIFLIVALGLLGGFTGQATSMKLALILIVICPLALWIIGALSFILLQKIITIPPLAAAWLMALFGATTMKAIGYRHEMRHQANRIKKMSQASVTVCPEDLCSILQDITGADYAIGIFKDRANNYSCHCSGNIDDNIKEEVQDLVKKNQTGLDKAVKAWTRAKAGKWYVFPVKSDSASLGVFMVPLQGNKSLLPERIEQARGFAAHCALLMEHKMLLEQLQENCKGTLEIIMSTLEKKAPGLLDHSRQVAELAREIARRMGMDEQEVDLIYKAGMLHDLGLVGVPDYILTKKAGLTPEERVWVESHPGIGADMVAQVPQLKKCVPLIRQHHERYDGKGYPDGLAGEEICLAARILAVAETFVSIMSKKFDQNPGADLAKLKEETLSELRRCAGTQFDMKVVQALLDIEKDIECR